MVRSTVISTSPSGSHNQSSPPESSPRPMIHDMPVLVASLWTAALYPRLRWIPVNVNDSEGMVLENAAMKDVKWGLSSDAADMDAIWFV